MRNLYLCLGTPASGKTYFIKKHHLEKYTLSADTLRELLGTYTPTINPNGEFETFGYDPSKERKVWSNFYYLLEERMKQGDTLFLDNTNLFFSIWDRIDELRKKYQYKVYVIDFMKPLLNVYTQEGVLDVLIERDLKRVERTVGKAQLNKYLYRYLDFKIPNWATQLEPNEVNLEDDHLINLDKFDNIKVIGDIHGDYKDLLDIFNQHKKGTAYIFVGDYLDRGKPDQIGKVLKFLIKLKGNNIFFLKGNHETNWNEFINQGRLTRGLKHSVKAMMDNHDYDSLDDIKKDLSVLNQQLKSYVHFMYNEEEYVVSHAGLEPCINSPWELRPETIFTNGANPNPYARNIDSNWSDDYFYNIHGHRNEFNVDVINGRAINLTKENEFRYIEITKEGITPHKIIKVDEVEGIKDWIKDLNQDPDVREKSLDDGIVSHNFTREVFKDGRWTPNTLKARGLFTKDNQIVGRGFNKFFNVGENASANLDNLGYPVEVHHKYNGFLGIVFYVDNEVKVMSKSGGAKYSELAYNVIKTCDEFKNIDKFYQDKTNQDKTLLYEIIDPVNDPHIIKYDKAQAVLLAIVDNTKTGLAKPTENTLMKVCNNREELEETLSKLDDMTIEGAVLYGANNYMLKYKTKYYLEGKRNRQSNPNFTPTWWLEHYKEVNK